MRDAYVGRMNRCGWLLAAALTSVLSSCSESATEIVVVVDTDYSVPSELALVRVSVESEAGAQVSTHDFTLAAAAEVPFSLAVVPSDATDAAVTIVAEGWTAPGGRMLVRRRAVTRFLPERSLLLDMFLARRCETEAATCGPTETCTERGCASAEIDPSTLEIVTPGGEIRRRDGGDDSGPGRDAMTDGGPPDAPFIDGGCVPGGCDDLDDCTSDSCGPTGACAHTTRDTDRDGHGAIGCAELGGIPPDDCNDADPNAFPGAPDTCDGVDNNCNTTCDEGLECCRGSTSGCTTTCGTTGVRLCSNVCAWSACSPPAEVCNGTDDNCNGECDEGFGCCRGMPSACRTACGSLGMQTCDDSCVAGTCVIPAEACNGADDDCDSRSDEGFPCEAGSTSPCTATCGSTGTRTCATDCSLGTCTPPAEVCGNAADDDCDSRVDEDCMAMCTGTCPGAVSVAAPGGRRTIAVSGSSMYTGTGACAGATGPEAVLTFTLSSASDVFITTHGSNIDTVLYVRSCTCSGVQIGCNDDSDALPTSVLQLDDLSGGTYTVFADTKAAMSVSLQIDLHISPNDTPGDRCGHPLPFHLTTPVMGNTCMLDSDTNGACPGEYVASLDGPDRIYYFVVTGAPHTVTLDTCTGCSTYDTALDLRRVCTSAGSTERVACDDDQCRSACSAIMRPIQSRLSSSLAPGLYYVFVDGYGTSCGDFTLTAP